MVHMREAQFSEGAMRSINATVGILERQETLHFLEQDANLLGNSIDDISDISSSGESEKDLFSLPDTKPDTKLSFPSPFENMEKRYRNLQESIRSQYIYQRGLLNEVILSILYDASRRPVIERADSAMIRKALAYELANNGLEVPFAFAVTESHGGVVYSTPDFNLDLNEKQIYTARLFPNSDSRYELKVEFPTRTNYIFSSVRFVIPTLALTLLLLAIFILTVIMAFRQKKIGEMKTDFINNMTHELKTPISTISLAAQMLNDDSVRKSPATLHHLSDVINAESKRLRFQVEKVLQMSVLEDSDSALNFTHVDANKVIAGVVSTFKIKVEKFGGSLSFHNGADDSMINVDEMQFTNVIFSLLDNAVKYRNEEVEPHLVVTTADASGHRLMISIRDNGIGMRKEDLKKIFEKFYRVPTGNRHDVKGFGLGLAYVKRMVTLFGGSIGVESELGKGSTFTMYIPLLTPENDNSDKKLT